MEQKEKKKIGGEKKKKVTFTTLHFHNLALFHLEKKMNRWLREEAEAVTNREPLLGSGEVRLRERCLDKDQKGEKGRYITNSGKEKETTPCKALVVFWCFINMCMSFICTRLLQIVSAIWQHGTRSLISLALCLTLFFSLCSSHWPYWEKDLCCRTLRAQGSCCLLLFKCSNVQSFPSSSVISVNVSPAGITLHFNSPQVSKM